MFYFRLDQSDLTFSQFVIPKGSATNKKKFGTPIQEEEFMKLMQGVQFPHPCLPCPCGLQL
jgi:hypothetical protein